MRFGLLIAGLAAASAATASAGQISQPTPYDPLLSGRQPGPCNPHLAGAAVVSGADVQGNPVAPADASTPAQAELGSDTVVPDLALPNSSDRLRARVEVPGLADRVARANPETCAAPGR